MAGGRRGNGAPHKTPLQLAGWCFRGDGPSLHGEAPTLLTAISSSCSVVEAAAGEGFWCLCFWGSSGWAALKHGLAGVGGRASGSFGPFAFEAWPGLLWRDRPLSPSSTALSGQALVHHRLAGVAASRETSDSPLKPYPVWVAAHRGQGQKPSFSSPFLAPGCACG